MGRGRIFFLMTPVLSCLCIIALASAKHPREVLSDVEAGLNMSVTALSPPSGPLDGGTRVVIMGSGFPIVPAETNTSNDPSSYAFSLEVGQEGVAFGNAGEEVRVPVFLRRNENAVGGPSAMAASVSFDPRVLTPMEPLVEQDYSGPAMGYLFEWYGKLVQGHKPSEDEIRIIVASGAYEMTTLDNQRSNGNPLDQINPLPICHLLFRVNDVSTGSHSPLKVSNLSFARSDGSQLFNGGSRDCLFYVGQEVSTAELEVYFGDEKATVDRFAGNSSERLYVITPKGTGLGPVDVRVLDANNPSNSAVLEGGYTYIEETIDATISGFVTDQRTRTPLADVLVELMDNTMSALLASERTHEEGNFYVSAPDTSTWLKVRFTHEDYDAKEIGNFFAPRILNVALTPRAPVAPTGLLVKGSSSEVLLRWNPNAEADLAGYNVYRADLGKAEFAKINVDLVPSPEYHDLEIQKDLRYQYRATAVDREGNESAFSEVVEAFAGITHVSLPDISGEARSIVRIPVNIKNAAGVNPFGMDIWVAFDETLVDYSQERPIWVERTAVTSQVRFLYNRTERGIVKIVSIGEADTLRGEGHLFDLYLRLAPGSEQETCGLTAFDKVSLYDEAPEPLEVDYSDTGMLCVKNTCIEGDISGDGTVDDLDVDLALQIAVGLFEADKCQMSSGDLNGDGIIDSADALMIQRLVSGLPLNPPQPDEKVFDTDDVPLAKTLKGALPISVALGNVAARPGEIVEIPIALSQSAGLAAMNATVNFTPHSEWLTLHSLSPGDITAGFQTNARASASHVNISMAGESSIGEGPGNLATLTFRLSDSAPEGAELPITLGKIELKGAYGDSFGWFTEVNSQHGLITVLPSYHFADIDQNEVVDAADVQTVINTALGLEVNVDCDLNDSGAINAVDVQLVINAVLGT